MRYRGDEMGRDSCLGFYQSVLIAFFSLLYVFVTFGGFLCITFGKLKGCGWEMGSGVTYYTLYKTLNFKFYL